MAGEQIKVMVKKYWPIAVGAVVVIYLYEKNKSNATNAGSQIAYVPAPADNTSALQAQLQAAQIGLAQQQESDAAASAQQQSAIQYTAALGGAAQDVGSAIAQIYQAEGQLPAQAIASASAQNQTALVAAANVAATGANALPSYLNAAANVTASAYLPLASYAQGIGGIVTSVEGNSAATLNAVAGTGGTAAQSAASSATAGAMQSANQGRNTVNGAATGAATGAMFGPYGAVVGGVVGGAAGFFSS